MSLLTDFLLGPPPATITPPGSGRDVFTKVLDAPLADSTSDYLFDALAPATTLPLARIVRVTSANMTAAGSIVLPGNTDGVQVGDAILLIRYESGPLWPITVAAGAGDSIVALAGALLPPTLSQPYDQLTVRALAGPIADGTIVWLASLVSGGTRAYYNSLLSNGDTPGVTLIGDEFGQAIVVPLS